MTSIATLEDIVARVGVRVEVQKALAIEAATGRKEVQQALIEAAAGRKEVQQALIEAAASRRELKQFFEDLAAKEVLKNMEMALGE